MTIRWQFIAYLCVFLAGIQWERGHVWLCLALIGGAWVAHWYRDHSSFVDESDSN
jgi:hypothetical protein